MKNNVQLVNCPRQHVCDSSVSMCDSNMCGGSVCDGSVRDGSVCDGSGYDSSVYDSIVYMCQAKRCDISMLLQNMTQHIPLSALYTAKIVGVENERKRNVPSLWAVSVAVIIRI